MKQTSPTSEIVQIFPSCKENKLCILYKSVYFDHFLTCLAERGLTIAQTANFMAASGPGLIKRRTYISYA
jgi:hypothetical protein